MDDPSSLSAAAAPPPPSLATPTQYSITLPTYSAVTDIHGTTTLVLHHQQHTTAAPQAAPSWPTTDSQQQQQQIYSFPAGVISPHGEVMFLSPAGAAAPTTTPTATMQLSPTAPGLIPGSSVNLCAPIVKQQQPEQQQQQLKLPDKPVTIEVINLEESEGENSTGLPPLLLPTPAATVVPQVKTVLRKENLVEIAMKEITEAGEPFDICEEGESFLGGDSEEMLSISFEGPRSVPAETESTHLTAELKIPILATDITPVQSANATVKEERVEATATPPTRSAEEIHTTAATKVFEKKSSNVVGDDLLRGAVGEPQQHGEAVEEGMTAGEGAAAPEELTAAAVPVTTTEPPEPAVSEVKKTEAKLKSFSDKLRELRALHEQKKKEPSVEFSCEKCGRKYKYLDFLKVHQRRPCV